jgi:hypothetical protein
LNAVLDEFVSGTKTALRANFCGAYLTGSFALGAADEHSDVDFLVVTHQLVDERQLTALNSLHGRLYRLDTPWAQHLEGSYVPEESLRHVDCSRTPFPFLDNGATELEWDDHCNTALVRWTMREKGVVLVGPHPTTLVAPVAPDDLRREAAAGIAECAGWAPEPTKTGGMSRWKQPYLVLTFCRMLNTLETATVLSKADAATWAMRELGPEWTSLIRAAVDDRPDPWARVHQPADDARAALTLAFAQYAVAEAARRSSR